MASTLNPATLEKLLHPIQEIRVRSLHDIESTLRRALWENVDIGVNASVLFRNLIRWFGHVPLLLELTVLEMMSLLLESQYGQEIVTFFTPTRVIKELQKIRYLTGSNAECHDLVETIIKQVECIKTGSTTSSMASSIDLDSVTNGVGNLKLDTIELTNDHGETATSGKRKGTVLPLFASRWKGDDSLYTDCWEVQDPSVARMLERFNESLLDEKNDENFQRTLNYIIPYTKNYPPEFFLQPPYIGLTLLHLIETGRVSIRKGYVMLLYIVESFRKRIRQRMLTVTYIPVQEKRARTQLSLGAFVYEMFRQCIDQMKELSCDVDELASNMMLIVLNQTTTFLMTEHFSDQQKIPAHRFGELCGSLGYLAKHYRQEFELDTNRLFTRTRYRITMQILLDFVRLWQKEPEAEYESDEAGAGGRSGTLHYKFADIKLSSSAHRTALEHSDRIWRDECLIALYDYPLKYSCPEMYEYLCTLVDRQKAPLLNLVLNMNDLLSPAVQLLRDTYINAELSDEHMLVMGSLAIKTLCLHRSMELVRILLQKIGNCSSFVTEDEPLWDIMESITVRLLANEDQDIRSEVYEICAKMMKDFVGQLDESAILTRSCLLSSTAPKLRAMGIPLTLEILTEITCFGYKDKNSKIHQSAETMLLLLCNSKAYLQEKWMDVQEVLLPIAPLLLAATVELKESKLGRVVLAMFHPDFGLPWLETLQGNLRLMFHVHGSIREEALTRVLFLLSSVERSEEFAPRIEHIGDTIPNSICMLPVPYGVGRQQIANVYDVGAVKPLLDALEQENGDPALRRSALTQLNVMADDPVLCEEIHNTSGWALVMEALCRSLQIDPQQEYPDAAIPAVGILTKLCFGIKVLRRYLGSNTTVFQLIVRALFVHHHLPVFRMECCALLYLLLFSECSTGTTPMVSLPYVCATSAFSIPFICHFHWSVSPFREVVGANGLLEGIMNNSSEDRNGAPRSDDGIAALAKVENLPHGFAVQEYVKRYIRFTFAELWYDDVDKILQLCNFKRASKASSLDDHESPLKYQGYRTALAFSADMRLSKHDIRWLKMVDFMPVFRKSLRRLGSAKAHADVHIGLATIETHLIFPLKNTVCQQDVIISTLKRYLHTPPVTVADQEMLVEVFHIIGIMLHHSFHLIRDWLYSVLATEDNFFLRLLRSDECIEPLYRKNASLLWALLQLHDAAKRSETSGSEPKQQQKDGKRELTERVSSNAVERAAVCENAWDLRVFNTALKQLDVMLKKWDVPRIVSLLQVLETMSALLDDVRRVDIAEVIPQLLHCVRAVRSTNFNGSAIVRSCLLAIAHLLERSPAEVAGFEWKSKDIVIVSTQCGNSCTLVRSFAWNILAKIARTLPGAAAIVKECAYLPGGIHACCVSTMLDRKEACLVKESAVGLLVNLLSHHTDTDGPLHSSVLPLDATAIARRAATNANSVFTNGSVDVIAELLAKQHFYEESNRSLEIYTCMEFLLDDDNKQQDPVISADLVRAFAVLYRSLIELDPFEFGLPIREKGCLQRLLKCVEQQAMLPNRAVCLMVADVCHLLLRCMDGPTRDPVCLLLAAHQNFFESIIYMLNPWLYGKLTQPVMEQTLYSIMRLLCALVVTPTGKQQIHLEFDHQDVKPIAKMIENGIVHKSKVFHMLCLKFLSLMFHTSEPIASPTGEYPSFLMQFDTMDMLAEGPDTAKSSSSLMFQDEDYSEVEDDTENTNPNRPMPTGTDTEKRLKTDDTKEGTTLRSGSALIFKALLQRFKSTCNTHNLETGCFGSTNYKRTVFSTLQTMLRFSGEACRVAREHNLLAIILDWFDTIYENQIGRLSCPEFVRKHGDVKKLSIVTELKELVSLLGTWFSVPGEPLLLRMDQIDRLCQTVLQYWPWFKTHAVLHLEFLQVLAFLTESHIIVCKALAATYPGYPHSIMKLLIVTATTETAKVKGAKYDLQLLRVSLRVLKNCCCGHEGRNMIGKLNVFDNISKLHPSVTKLQKPWIEVTQMWLEFWEVYTRYADVSEVRHLTVLGALTRKSDLEIRLLAMAIVRNLTFVIGNRPTLLASLDYMFILSNALQRTSSRDELLMAAVTVWRMVANSHRGKAAIKSSPLVRLIEGQVKHYSMTPEGNDQNELWNVLMTVYRILKA